MVEVAAAAAAGEEEEEEEEVVVVVMVVMAGVEGVEGETMTTMLKWRMQVKRPKV